MNLIAEIILTSLEELFQRAAIEDYQDMEEFHAECLIEYDLTKPNGVTIVTMCDWLVFIWWMVYPDGTQKLEAYHAFSLTTAECQGCGANQPTSDLWDFHGRRLCDTCRWVGLPKSA